MTKSTRQHSNDSNGDERLIQGGQKMTGVSAEQEFLRECNGNRTVRIFGPADFQAYRNAVKEAKRALRHGEPYYASDHAGTCMADFNYPKETAAWSVWVLHDTVRSEYGSRAIDRTGGRMQYDEASYLAVWRHREWTSPVYSVGHGLDVHILAHWQISDGQPIGRAEMTLVSPAGRPAHFPSRVSETLPKKLQSVLKGTSWAWPEGTLATDCEAIVRARAEEIAELLRAFAVNSAAR